MRYLNLCLFHSSENLCFSRWSNRVLCDCQGQGNLVDSFVGLSLQMRYRTSFAFFVSFWPPKLDLTEPVANSRWSGWFWIDMSFTVQVYKHITVEYPYSWLRVTTGTNFPGGTCRGQRYFKESLAYKLIWVSIVSRRDLKRCNLGSHQNPQILSHPFINANVL